MRGNLKIFDLYPPYRLMPKQSRIKYQFIYKIYAVSLIDSVFNACKYNLSN